MRTIRHHILVRISEAKRRELFEKPIKRDDGEVVYLVTGIKAEAGTDASYSQSVSIGEVLEVGDEVEEIKVGDTAMLDYIVDLTEEIVVSSDKEYKIVRLDTRTRYKTKNLIVDANRRTPQPTVVHRKGDLHQATLLIAIVRNNVIYPHGPYIFLEHKERDSEFKIEEGSKFFTLEEEENVVVERKVMATNLSGEYKVGDTVMVESDAIFNRQLNGQMFDVVFDNDIVAVLAK